MQGGFFKSASSTYLCWVLWNHQASALKGPPAPPPPTLGMVWGVQKASMVVTCWTSPGAQCRWHGWSFLELASDDRSELQNLGNEQEIVRDHTLATCFARLQTSVSWLQPRQPMTLGCLTGIKLGEYKRLPVIAKHTCQWSLKSKAVESLKSVKFPKLEIDGSLPAHLLNLVRQLCPTSFITHDKILTEKWTRLWPNYHILVLFFFFFFLHV